MWPFTVVHLGWFLEAPVVCPHCPGPFYGAHSSYRWQASNYLFPPVVYLQPVTAESPSSRRHMSLAYRDALALLQHLLYLANGKPMEPSGRNVAHLTAVL